MSGEKRIAMWSGPRNISTAMMRAWGNRGDTAVVDEPFYAFYIARTNKAHPGAAEIIAKGERDWRNVVAQLTGDIPSGRKILFQKQMTHHLLPEVSRAWLAQVTNCFLIREPAAVIASYIKKNHEPTADDLGFPQQWEIFETARALAGTTPVVVDADDVLRAPARMLRLLCDAVGVEFVDSMLSWPPGSRASDGVWAKHWYTEVERSTCFAPYREQTSEVPSRLKEVYARCRGYYEQLCQCRLR